MPTETTTQVDGAYDKFVVTKRHLIEPNRIMLPVCKQTDEGEDQDEVVVQLAPPQHRLIVRFEIEKVGQAPHIPDPKPNQTSQDISNEDTNMVLLKAEVSPVSIDVSMDGQSVRYSVTGEYVYGFKRWKEGVMNAALPPWLQNLPETYQQPFYGSQDIINPLDETADILTANDVFNDALS